MKLIKMTDYVVNTFDGKVLYLHLEKVLNYAKFLKQPLKLSMFVPCDLDGNILEESEFHEPNNENEIGEYEELRYEYQQAKELILFDGFEIDCDNIIQSNNIRLWFKSELDIYIHNTRNKVFAIEDLIKYNLELTPATKKQFNI